MEDADDAPLLRASDLMIRESTAVRLQQQLEREGRELAHDDAAEREAARESARRAMHLVFTRKLERVSNAQGSARSSSSAAAAAAVAPSLKVSSSFALPSLPVAAPNAHVITVSSPPTAPLDMKPLARSAPSVALPSPPAAMYGSTDSVPSPRRALPTPPPDDSDEDDVSPVLSPRVTFAAKALPKSPRAAGNEEELAELRALVRELQAKLEARTCHACGCTMQCAECDNRSRAASPRVPRSPPTVPAAVAMATLGPSHAAPPPPAGKEARKRPQPGQWTRVTDRSGTVGFGLPPRAAFVLMRYCGPSSRAALAATGKEYAAMATWYRGTEKRMDTVLRLYEDAKRFRPVIDSVKVYAEAVSDAYIISDWEFAEAFAPFAILARANSLLRVKLLTQLRGQVVVGDMWLLVAQFLASKGCVRRFFLSVPLAHGLLRARFAFSERSGH